MSGRAGRRGKDDKGIVILMVDENMSPAVGKELVKGQADPLNSAFHLTYNMVRNGLYLIYKLARDVGRWWSAWFGSVFGMGSKILSPAQPRPMNTKPSPDQAQSYP